MENNKNKLLSTVFLLLLFVLIAEVAYLLYQNKLSLPFTITTTKQISSPPASCTPTSKQSAPNQTTPLHPLSTQKLDKLEYISELFYYVPKSTLQSAGFNYTTSLTVKSTTLEPSTVKGIQYEFIIYLKNNKAVGFTKKDLANLTIQNKQNDNLEPKDIQAGQQLSITRNYDLTTKNHNFQNAKIIIN